MHGARHDAYAFAASGLAEVLTDHPTVADLGYVGVAGIGPFPEPVHGRIRRRLVLGGLIHYENRGLNR